MISAAILLALVLLLFAPGYEYRQALPGYRYSFPRDHFAHPEFRTEWWYYTGNLRSGDGRRFGFELVFFRQARRRGPADNPSAWRVDDLYLAHAALTDVAAARFHYRKRLNRAGPGIAGASLDLRRIWNGNWSAEIGENGHKLVAIADEFRLTLNLQPEKPPVVHGVNGVSQKAAGRGKASHYVSFTRLAARGSIGAGKQRHEVTGYAWMDHEWFTHQLEAGQVGWDWFSVQLDDRTELMLFQLRRKDGTIEPYSSGTRVDSQGGARHLALPDFSLQPLEHWTSPKTGARYPVRWRIQVPSLGIDVECAAVLSGQEISAEGEGPDYWEGAVTYQGSHTGAGYLEMTGYRGPVEMQ
jgi:predicted secreted hydrolase